VEPPESVDQDQNFRKQCGGPDASKKRNTSVKKRKGKQWGRGDPTVTKIIQVVKKNPEGGLTNTGKLEQHPGHWKEKLMKKDHVIGEKGGLNKREN